MALISPPSCLSSSAWRTPWEIVGVRCDPRSVGLVLVPLLLMACGGGEPATVVASAPHSALRIADAERLVVVRFDFDGDAYADLLTLDASQASPRVVEALQGLAAGEFVDATSRWVGKRVPSALEEVLRAYLERSYAVGTETQLEALVRGQPVLVSVIE